MYSEVTRSHSAFAMRYRALAASKRSVQAVSRASRVCFEGLTSAGIYTRRTRNAIGSLSDRTAPVRHDVAQFLQRRSRRSRAGVMVNGLGVSRTPRRYRAAWQSPAAFNPSDHACLYFCRDSATEAAATTVNRESPARRFRGAPVQIAAHPASNPPLPQWRHLAEASRGWRSIGLHHLSPTLYLSRFGIACRPAPSPSISWPARSNGRRRNPAPEVCHRPP